MKKGSGNTMSGAGTAGSDLFTVQERPRQGVPELTRDRACLARTGPLEFLLPHGPGQCAALRARLLVLLRQSRDPYWNVLIEHGVEPDGPVVDVSERPGRRLAHLR